MDSRLDINHVLAVDIPSDFAGAAALATSVPDQTDQSEAWKDTLPVSWECNPAFDSFDFSRHYLAMHSDESIRKRCIKIHH
jgi:hypothetical protein